MSEHTKGPWRVQKFSLTVFTISDSDGTGMTNAIAGTLTENNSAGSVVQRQEAFANARLIAAAPDLLEALEVLVSSEYDDGDLCDADWAKANAAIFKARGKECAEDVKLKLTDPEVDELMCAAFCMKCGYQVDTWQHREQGCEKQGYQR